MIVDCNAYVGKWPYWPNPYMSEDGLLRLMDRHDVARAVVTSTRSIMINPHEGNAECREIVARHPDRISWLACIDPCDDEAALVECERAVGEGAVGLRLAPQHQSWMLPTDPFVDDLVAAATRWRKPVVLPFRLVMDWRLPKLG
ncbi:MAG: amidohydrolase family protein, partial [Chloroflexota bacterium]